MLQLRLSFVVAMFALAAVAAPPVKSFDAAPHDSTGCVMQGLKLDGSETDLPLVCSPDFDRTTGGTCSAIFKNYGPSPCVGKMVIGIGVITQGTVDSGSTEGPITMNCRRVGLTTLPPAGQPDPTIEAGVVCDGDGSVPSGGRMKMTVHMTPGTFTVSPWRIAAFQNFTTSATTLGSVVTGQGNLNSCNVVLSVPGTSRSGVPYQVSWTAAVGATQYEVQQATSPAFSDAATTVTSNTSVEFTNTVSGQPKNYFYKVRATQCRNNPGPFSRVEDVIVIPELPPTSRQFDINLLQGSQTPVNQLIRWGNLRAGAPFTATVDRLYLMVTPATGNVASDGTVTVTVRADPRGLPFGANQGTVTITVAAAKTGNGPVSLADNIQSTPVSVTITSPVTAAPKTPPPATTWLVPAVAHKDGIGAQFVSDVKLANVNVSVASSYQLTYTPTASDGSVSGRTTKIDLSPGQQASLGDILKSVFGLGTTSADASGVLEVRMLSTAATGTLAASRTYSSAEAGTFGQFIPAVSIDRVATASSTSAATPLIFSHVGQSVASRMNLGLVEALGFATTGTVRVFDANGQALGGQPISFSLRPFEHIQINSFLARNGIAASNVRLEVSVDNLAPGTTPGGITAYVSQLDNSTHDGSVISGVKSASVLRKRFILPGISEGTTTGEHSEVRVLNASSVAANATLTFYKEGAPGAPIVRNETIAPGEIKSYDNIVASLFGTSGRGSLVVTTTEDRALLISGRTFSASPTGGSYGQFQSALSTTDGIGTTDGEMQLLQLEESDKFRSDVAIAELNGTPAEVQISLIAPDGKSAPSTRIPLAANEFVNLQSVIAQMGATGNVYNARITLKVVSGTGRIGAYAAMVDKTTNDPTLFPGQK